MIYRPSAHPGCVATHLWLKDGTSLYDHFGEGFTLLVTGDGETKDLQEGARGLGVPLKVIRPQEHRLPARYGAAFALIRPDQHVAWRGNSLADFEAVLHTVTGTA